MRIQVTPEHLEQLAGEFQRVSAGLVEVGNRCQGALASLEWEARQKAGVDGQVQAAVRQARALADEAEALARFLRNAAQRFAAADREALPLAGGAVLGAVAPPPFWRLPEAGLGGLPFLPLPRVVFPAGGLALGGLFAGALGQAASDLVERVWNWLHGYGWRENSEFLSPLHDDETGVPKGRLAEVIRKGVEESASPSASRQPAPNQSGDAVSKQPPSEATVPYGHSVPRISQQGLKYGGQNTQYGCTAASTAMVLDYWHSSNPNMGRLSAQEILDANIKQGKFSPGSGLSTSQVHDEVRALGYSVVEDRINSDFETLKRDVEQGPVIAIVKLGMQKSGYNHAVVVTGISEDGRRVRVNDPWDGQSHEYAAETFLASWGADFGKDVPRNNYTVIRP